MRDLQKGDRVTYSVAPDRAFGTVYDGKYRGNEIEILWDRTTLPMPHDADRLAIVHPDMEELGS